MFHRHHQSHNVKSNIDNYSTPIRGESLDENKIEYDDDDNENEGNDQDDQYGEDGVKMEEILFTISTSTFTIWFTIELHSTSSTIEIATD